MTTLANYLSEVYSEELFTGISEVDYDNVMSASAVDDGWQGYYEWSQKIESDLIIVAESENFVAYFDGTVRHRPEPKSNGRLEGIEL